MLRTTRLLRRRATSSARRISLLTLAACATAPSLVAHAANGTWTNPASNAWSDTASWLGGTVADGSGATANFSTIDLTTDIGITLDTPRTVGNLTFADTDPATAGNWTINDAGNTSNTLTLAGGTPTVTVGAMNAASAATIAAIITGNQGLRKDGAGTLVLAGSNTYTGATVLNAGTLSISGSNNLNNNGPITFNGGTLRLTGAFNNLDAHTINWATFNGGIDVATASPLTVSNVISGTGSFTKAGTGTVILSGNNNYTGGTTIAAGTLQIGDGTNNGALVGAYTGPGTLSINRAGASTVNNTINTGSLGLAGGQVTLTGTVTLSGALNISANAAGSPVLTVDGGSLTAGGLSTVNAGTGAGQFILQSGSATFNGGIRTSNNDGAVIRVNGGTFTASDVTVQRNRATGAPNYLAGFIFAGGTGNIGTANIGTNNSNGDMSVEGGSLTATGAVTIGRQASGNRGGTLRVINPGTVFTITDPVDGLVLGRTATGGNTNQNASATFTGGISTISKITLGYDSTVTGTATVLVNGGTLYLGPGGFSRQGSATQTVNVNLNSTTSILGAYADSTSNAPINLQSATFTVQAADAASVPHNMTWAGVLAGTGTLIKTGGGTLDLQGANTWTGGATVNAGTLAGKASSLRGNITNNTTVSLSDQSGSSTLGAIISGTGSVTKTGAGTSIIANPAAQTYTGQTVASAGLLSIQGNLANSSGLSVTSGGGVLVPSTGTTVKTLSFGSSGADAMTLSLNDGSGIHAITVSNPGGLSTAGTTTIDIGVTGLTVGQFVAVDYSGTIGGSGFSGFTLGALPPRMIASLVNNVANTSVDVNITGFDIPRWNGNVAGGVWDINTTQNWRTITSNVATTYLQASVPGDQVLFNDLAAGTTTVTLNTTVQPSFVTFNNSTKNYTLTGSGKISGPTPLVKTGTGSLTLANTGGNDYTGGTTLQAGTLIIPSTDSLPDAGALTVAGGTLDLSTSNALPATGNVTVSGGTVNLNGTNQDVAGGFSLQGGSVLTGQINKTGANFDFQAGSISANLTGDVGLTKSGTGTVIITNHANYSGSTSVQAGTLQFGDGVTEGNLQSGLGTIANSGTVAFNQPNDFIWAGNISGLSGTVVKDGPANLYIAGNNEGNFQVKAGTVTVTTGGGVPRIGRGGTVTVDAGATLVLEGTTPLGLGTQNNPPANVINGTVQVSSSTDAQFYGMTLNNGGLITSAEDPTSTVTFRENVNVPADAHATISAYSVSVANSRAFVVGTNATLTLSGNLNGAGTYAKSGGGTMILSGNNDGFTGITIASQGTLVARPSAWNALLVNAGGLTINTARVVFDYAGTSSPASTVVPLLKASHDSMNFRDPAQKIRDGVADDGAHGLAYIDDAASSTLTVLHTWYGDMNLDGTINGDDYTLYDRAVAMNLPADAWVRGDFNYDGLRDAADLLRLDTSYGRVTGVLSPGLLALRQAEFGDAYVASLIAAVPEPTSLLAAVGLAIPLLTRRRTR